MTILRNINYVVRLSPMTSEDPHRLQGRREDFPVDVFRHLESKIHILRVEVMRRAAALAAWDPAQRDLTTFTVGIPHVRQAVDELFDDPSLPGILGLVYPDTPTAAT